MYLKQRSQNSGACIAILERIDELRQNAQLAERRREQIQRRRQVVEEIILCFLVLNLSRVQTKTTTVYQYNLKW